MLFGTYTDRGDQTCAGRPAALNHEKIDAETYASWGVRLAASLWRADAHAAAFPLHSTHPAPLAQVDYLKEDSCHATTDHGTAFEEYGRMRDALNATGRHILFSLCGEIKMRMTTKTSHEDGHEDGHEDSHDTVVGLCYRLEPCTRGHFP